MFFISTSHSWFEFLKRTCCRFLRVFFNTAQTVLCRLESASRRWRSNALGAHRGTDAKGGRDKSVFVLFVSRCVFLVCCCIVFDVFNVFWWLFNVFFFNVFVLLFSVFLGCLYFLWQGEQCQGQGSKKDATRIPAVIPAFQTKNGPLKICVKTVPSTKASKKREKFPWMLEKHSTERQPPAARRRCWPGAHLLTLPLHRRFKSSRSLAVLFAWEGWHFLEKRILFGAMRRSKKSSEILEKHEKTLKLLESARGSL